MKIRYFMRVLSGVRLKRLFQVVDNIHKKTGISKTKLVADILSCARKYGAGYNDYEIFEFYNMTDDERKTYLTRFKNKELITKLNDPAFTHIFDEKNVFDKKFEKFLGREVLDLAEIDLERFKSFINGKDTFFAKPYIGESGKGIEKIKVSSFATPEELYKYVTNPEKNFGLIEEVVVQHPQAAKIYPYSLNCLRIVTLVNEGRADILYAVFKMGNDGKFVDNLENGGLACHFDLDKGVVIGPGHTSELVTHDKHPYTEVPFIGYKLPFMKEVKAMVKEAAMVIPQVRYVGWDVCITPNGPAIIEGNDYPAYDFPQLPDVDKPRIGLFPKIQKIMSKSS